jgi:hypothetical protein
MYTLTANDTMTESQHGWPDIIVPDAMYVASLAEAYPHEATDVAHEWGVEGWTSYVRYRLTERRIEVVLAVALHGKVLWWKPFDTVVEAREAVEDSRRLTACAVSRTLAAYVESMCYPPGEDGTWQQGLLDARWYFQALTGMHIGFVNALVEQQVTYTQLMFLCRARPSLRDAFVQALVFPEMFDLEQPRWMWSTGSEARFASAHDLQRLFGARQCVDLNASDLPDVASHW